jgi:hypothetical protein
MSDNEEHPLRQLISTFTVDETEYENTLHEHLRINRGNLSGDYEKHSEYFAYWSTLYELALDHQTRAEIDLERLYAIIDAEKRSQLGLTGGKVTEKTVENAVITDDRYIAAQVIVLDAKRNTGLLKAGRDAMIHRRDMLVSLGANYRAESKSDISLLQDQYRNKFGNNG